VTTTVGEQLYRLRTARGLSQDQLGRAVGVSGPTISFWERRKSRVDADVLARVAEVLDYPITAFYEGVEAEPSILDPGELLRQANALIMKAMQITAGAPQHTPASRLPDNPKAADVMDNDQPPQSTTYSIPWMKRPLLAGIG
jgi:transcriptional regulator with XRE-family HTH domain